MYRMLILCDINLKARATRIKRDIQKDSRITTSTKVCSAHFTEADFVIPNTKSRRLKTSACRSVLQWKQAMQPRESSELEEDLKLQEEELTAPASEVEGIYEGTLDSKLNRGIKYCCCKGKSCRYQSLFGCNIAAEPERRSDSEDEDPEYVDRIKEHKLELEDEFLLFMMRLKLGLSCLDLSLRFCISEGTVNTIVMVWLNFLYVLLGHLKIWPHRNVVLSIR